VTVKVARETATVDRLSGGYPGKRKPLRRAVRFQGFFPVDLEHQDQLAEIVAEIASVREEIGRDVQEPFDVVAALPADTDPAPSG
jgi:hypothetical protein